jgi:hypothetical protein
MIIIIIMIILRLGLKEGCIRHWYIYLQTRGFTSDGHVRCVCLIIVIIIIIKLWWFTQFFRLIKEPLAGAYSLNATFGRYVSTPIVHQLI